MKRIVFYSWQSDVPGKLNRYFIEDALKDATALISNDDSVEESPRVETDTLGIPGSPDIFQTILDKIEQSDVFVCDLTVINSTVKDEFITTIINNRLIDLLNISDGATNSNTELSVLEKALEIRLTPNPNVLIELGYALKTLGGKRVIMVINEYFCERNQLPFDLHTKRVHSYCYDGSGGSKQQIKQKLVNFFALALRTIFDEIGKLHVKEEIISLGLSLTHPTPL